MQKILELKIADLRLDLENPRYPERKSELEALKAIIDEQGSKIAMLAEDIADFGLSPVDRMMVLEDETTDSYISLEGNRRTAALKILNTPNVLDDMEISASIKKRLKAAAAKFDPEAVEPISAVEMPSRESARRWIELRHTGENEGRGIVGWTGYQTGRFRGSKEVLLLDLAKSKFGVTDDEIGPKFPITTLERLIDNPEVRDFIGLTVIDGQLHITRPISEVQKPLSKIIRDLGSKSIKVDKVKTADQQKEYIKSFDKNDKPSSKKLKQTRSVASIIDQTQKPITKTKIKGPLDRNTIVPKGYMAEIEGDKAEQAIYELKRLNVDRMPLSGAITLRLFIEISVGHFLTQKADGIYLTDDSGNLKTDGAGNPIALKIGQRIEKACKLAKTLYPKDKTAINSARQTLTNQDGLMSIQALHEYTHNAHAIPAAKDLKTLWSNSSRFIQLMWEK